MRRREQREHIFKLLFMTQFNTETEMSQQLSMYFEGLGELDEKDQEAMQAKYSHILEHLDEIDQVLNDFSRGWKTTRMNRVDLTALRLAVYEMKFDEDIPTGVAINEAVELAKSFGGDDSGSFVNGVLGKIASGGELSRIMLAMKSVFGDGEKTAVFDEIDAGVSGGTSYKVGRKLHALAAGTGAQLLADENVKRAYLGK